MTRALAAAESAPPAVPRAGAGGLAGPQEAAHDSAARTAACRTMRRERHGCRSCWSRGEACDSGAAGFAVGRGGAPCAPAAARGRCIFCLSSLDSLVLLILLIAWVLPGGRGGTAAAAQGSRTGCRAKPPAAAPPGSAPGGGERAGETSRASADAVPGPVGRPAPRRSAEPVLDLFFWRSPRPPAKIQRQQPFRPQELAMLKPNALPAMAVAALALAAAAGCNPEPSTPLKPGAEADRPAPGAPAQPAARPDAGKPAGDPKPADAQKPAPPTPDKPAADAPKARRPGRPGHRAAVRPARGQAPFRVARPTPVQRQERAPGGDHGPRQHPRRQEAGGRGEGPGQVPDGPRLQHADDGRFVPLSLRRRRHAATP